MNLAKSNALCVFRLFSSGETLGRWFLNYRGNLLKSRESRDGVSLAKNTRLIKLKDLRVNFIKSSKVCS